MTDLRKAAQQALEALENSSPDQYPEDAGVFYDAITALRTALEQQAEPVAWMDRDGDVYPMPENKKWAPPHVLLYTTPPQRKWQGLTDEDVRQCSQDVVAGGPENSVDRFAYAIEAKLKERNNG